MPFESPIEQLQRTFKRRTVDIEKPEDSDFPELIITVPDSWKQIRLAPLYDVHVGSADHDASLFSKHLDWIEAEQDVLTFNGGDMYENATKHSPGGSAASQALNPTKQMLKVAKILAPIQHKMLFALPGNHEDRTFNESGLDGARQLAEHLRLPYFPDYCFCTIKWRGNNFRLCAHHGSGGGSTAGAQRNAARKDMPWGKFDIFWTGHVHQPMADLVYQTDYDQRTGRMVPRECVTMISPSYVKYFGSYAAKKRLAPSSRGLSVITLQPDGRIDTSLQARGKRL